MRTTTIKVIDNRRQKINNRTVSCGLYDGKIIHFGLRNEVNEEGESYEVLLIKYGSLKDFELCSCYTSDPTFVYLSATVNGKYGDIKLDPDMWLKILGKLDSVIIMQQWRDRLNLKQVA